ncbi:MAG: GIY-YIG nuclease family protein [Ignavibacteria bacterium]|nr:GIY-YIG nuclease family protein [Ignavibacteria bacterium]
MFYLYILYSKSINHYYIGQTSDLDGRLRSHISSSTCSN